MVCGKKKHSKWYYIQKNKNNIKLKKLTKKTKLKSPIGKMSERAKKSLLG